MRVSSIIIVLVISLTCVGLFIVAARKARQAAFHAHCMNNLKQLAMSMQNYHDCYRRFPSATASDIWNRPGMAAMAPTEQRMSWLFEISVFVEARMDQKWRLDNSKPWDAAENQYVANSEMPYYFCPAHSALGADRLWADYVGIAGLGKNAIRLPKTDKNAGMFGYDRRLTLDDITDGTSSTIAISETARDNDRWAKPGDATVRGLDPDGGPYLGVGGQFNSHHYEGIWDKRCRTNVALADASVKTLSDRISSRVFEALATIAGGEKIEPGDW